MLPINRFQIGSKIFRLQWMTMKDGQMVMDPTGGTFDGPRDSFFIYVPEDRFGITDPDTHPVEVK
jgi:hypothetical protein